MSRIRKNYDEVMDGQKDRQIDNSDFTEPSAT